MGDGISRQRPHDVGACGRPPVWLLGLTAALLVLFALSGEGGRALLRYERSAVMAGEWWRLASGHFVHGSHQHLLLNMAGLGVIGALFPRDYSAAAWLFVALSSLIAIDVGFVLWEPQLEWYVGFSGVLHGALAAGTVAWWRHEKPLLALILTVVLVGKLAWEQTLGALPLSGDLPVVVDAHLYGACGGWCAATLVWVRQRYWSP